MPRSSWNRLDLPQDQIRELVTNGESREAMARHFGVTRKVIDRICHELGLVPKPGYKGQPMEKNYFWAGGRTVEKKAGRNRGVRVKAPNHPNADRHGYVREHRLVMEKKLGRLLERQEVVHHIDGNPLNNDPGNLMVFGRNAEHLRHELKGRVPNWTEAGRRRTLEGVRRGAVTRRNAMLDRILDQLSGHGAPVSRRSLRYWKQLAKDPQFPSEIFARDSDRLLSEPSYVRHLPTVVANLYVLIRDQSQ